MVVQEKLALIFETVPMFEWNVSIQVDCFGKLVVVVVMNEVTESPDEVFFPKNLKKLIILLKLLHRTLNYRAILCSH